VLGGNIVREKCLLLGLCLVLRQVLEGCGGASRVLCSKDFAAYFNCHDRFYEYLLSFIV